MADAASSNDAAPPDARLPPVGPAASVEVSTGSGGNPAAGGGYDAAATLVKTMRRATGLHIGKGKSIVKTNTKKPAELPVKIDYRRFTRRHL